MDFQIIKINSLNKIILGKTCLVMALEVLNGGIEPDWLAEIKTIAYFIQGMENLVCSGIVAVVLYDSVTDHAVIFKFFCP